MLSNYDLMEMAEHLNIKIDDICYKDNIIKNKKKRNLNIIINLQDEKNGNGTHWTVLLKKDKKYIYYDSFGAQPPKVIKDYCKQNLGYNNYIIQNLNTDTCGYYCLAFIHFLRNHKGNIYELTNDFTNLFEDDTKMNNDILFKYLNSI